MTIQMTLRALRERERERERVSECVHESVSKRKREKREPNARARICFCSYFIFSGAFVKRLPTDQHSRYQARLSARR